MRRLFTISTANRLEARRQLAAGHRPRGPRGIALLLVVTAIAIFAIVAIEFSGTTHTHLHQGVNMRDSVRANTVAHTGMVLTRACMDPTVWGPMAAMMQRVDLQKVCSLLLGVFMSGRVDLPMGLGLELDGIDGLGLSKGAIEELELTPEDSYIGLAGLFCVGGELDLNCATRQATAQKLRAMFCDPQIAHVFEKEQADGQIYSREEVIGNMIDWMDPDDTRIQMDPFTGQFAQSAGEGEDSYYGLTESRYRSKDAPFDSLEELRMIRGINDDLFEFLKTRVSVHGSEKVNVNYATAEVFKALLVASSPAFRNIENSFCGEELDPASGREQITRALDRYAQLIVKAREWMAMTQMTSGNIMGITFRNNQQFINMVADPIGLMTGGGPGQGGGSPMQGLLGAGQPYDAWVLQYFGNPAAYEQIRQLVAATAQNMQQAITTRTQSNRVYRLNVTARVGNITRRIFAILKQDGQLVRTLYYREE